MLLAATPPAERKDPPTTTLPGRSQSAVTGPATPIAPAAEVSDDHAVPFHSATPLASTPLALTKEPPASRLPFRLVSRVCTGPSHPAASVDQLLPFHSAMLFTTVPPAWRNWPPTAT